MLSVGKKIRAWRLHLRLQQAEFAKLAGIPKSTLTGYESAQREPGYASLCAIAKTGCDISWLLIGESENPPQANGNSPLEKILADLRGTLANKSEDLQKRIRPQILSYTQARVEEMVKEEALERIIEQQSKLLAEMQAKNDKNNRGG